MRVFSKTTAKVSRGETYHTYLTVWRGYTNINHRDTVLYKTFNVINKHNDTFSRCIRASVLFVFVFFPLFIITRI